MPDEKVVVVTLTIEKSTKNTVKYEEIITDEPPVTGSLYLQKYVVARMGNPQTIKVTIEPGR